MVGSTLGVYIVGLFLFLQEQIKDTIIICVRARAYVHKCTSPSITRSFSHIRVCVCVSLVDDSLSCKASPFLCALRTWQSLEQ
jgi:hypothetical protein